MKKIFQGSFLLISLTLISRVFGFIREMIIGYKYGVSEEVDLFNMSQTIGEVMGNMIISTSIITFTILSISNKKYNFNKFVTTMIILFSTLISILIYLNSDVLAEMFLQKKDNNLLQLSQLIRVSSISIIIFSLISMQIGYFQYKEKFAIPIIAVVVLNLSFIISLFIIPDVLENYKSSQILNFAYVLSLIVYLLFCTFFYVKYKKRSEVPMKIEGGTLKTLILFSSIIFTTLINKLIYVYERGIFSSLDPGQLSAYIYSQKIINLPLAIIGTTITGIMFVKLQRNKEKIELYLLILLISGYVIALNLHFFAEFIVSTLFQRGNFNEQAVYITAESLKLFALLLPYLIVLMLLNKIIYNSVKGSIITVTYIICFMTLILATLILKPTSIGEVFLIFSIYYLLQLLLILYLVKNASKKVIGVLCFIAISSIVIYVGSYSSYYFLTYILCLVGIFFVTKILKINIIKEFLNL